MNTPSAIAAALGLTAFAAFLEPAASVRSGADPVVIIDDDTIAVGHERIRLLDIDAPESFHSRCEAELVLGLKAKERLRQLVDGGPVLIDRHGHDRYGRTLARVTAGGVDVGAQLLAEGLALPYTPGHDAQLARLRSWCGPTARLD
jgi:endonuclease YncB( thermonuclease family)